MLLEGGGNSERSRPFTQFAPRDAEFAKFRQESRTLLQPKNKSMLQFVLAFVVVPGRFCAIEPTRQIAAAKVANRWWRVDEADDEPNRHACRRQTYPRFASQYGEMRSHGVNHVIDSLSLLG